MWRSTRVINPKLASIRLVPTFVFRSSQYRPKTTAVDDQAKRLLESPFWNKTLDYAIRMRDADKDGVISRKDYKLVAQRYKDLGGVSGEQLRCIQETLMKIFDSLGLTDDTKQLTPE